MILLKGKKGRHQGKKEGGNGTVRKDRRSKTREVGRKKKPPLLPQINSQQCPPFRLCSELLSRMPPPWDARPEQKGSGTLGRHTGQAARDHWACLALMGEVPLH